MKASNQASDGAMPVPTATPVDLELRAIDRQQRRFGRLSVLAIVVSFVHMAAALALFSGAAWYEVVAALAMTALVDVATWMLAGYFDYAARRQLARSRWIKVTFGFALAISMFLNGAYLYANRPASLPGWMGVAIAGAFAVFVPLLIGVASLIRGELEDDRLRIEQQAAVERPTIAAAPTPDIAPRRAALAQEKPSAVFANNQSAPRRDSANKPALANNGANVRTPNANITPLFANTDTARRTATANSAASRTTNANITPLFANTDTARRTATANNGAQAEAANAPTPPFANNGADDAATDESATPNSAAPIGTNDVAAIVAALGAANVTQFANARVLAKACGWASSSSGHKALKHLLDAGAVRTAGNGYMLVVKVPEASLST